MLSDDVLTSHLNNHCITICFGDALEAIYAAGDTKTPSESSSYFGEIGFCDSAFLAMV